MYASLEKSANFLARAMALAGGAVLIGVTLLTCASIAGRALLPLDIGLGPIKGIYDITEIGVAAAVFAFLPWCQMRGGHATVDLFAPAYGDAVNRALDLVIALAMCAAAAIIAWRLWLGMLDKQRYTETTQILQFPVWEAYLASLIGAVVFALVSAFCALRAGRAMLGYGREAPAHV